MGFRSVDVSERGLLAFQYCTAAQKPKIRHIFQVLPCPQRGCSSKAADSLQCRAYNSQDNTPPRMNFRAAFLEHVGEGGGGGVGGVLTQPRMVAWKIFRRELSVDVSLSRRSLTNIEKTTLEFPLRGVCVNLSPV